ncbi:transcription factor bHLH112-like isoform X1 [Olea europaea var. sylvestris]|uniref:transcription factor bHLH112-like isoform X1 n=1 Tax=Olea europaea var. sylvestris TaxID=158386 RepID=UPI000C1D3E03|nr:transcription factor bHLH112-like isoform X1 [Olea europaea var. sylvestris]
MAEEYFQGEVCGGNWWNSSRNIFGSSLCSSNINEIANFGWPNDMIMNMNTRSNDDSGSPSDGSIVLQDVRKPQQTDSEFIANGNIPIGSILQMMENESPSSTPDNWNRDLFHENGRLSQGNCVHILQENLASSMNYLQQTGINCPHIQKDWNSKNRGLDSSIYSSSLLNSLFDTDSQPHNSSLNNRVMNYQSPTSYLKKYSNEFAPPLPQLSPLIKVSLPNKKPAKHLQFSNNIPSLNAKVASLNDIRASLPTSTQSQFPSSNINSKPNLLKGVNKETRGLSSVAKKSSSEHALKRPRIETPSPSPPTFKVRKEKLGDRITVLQQLVSPFGKTDTASVLQETLEYIKFLHDQVSVLSTSYMKNGSFVERQQAADKQDLKSRGLCLVPISGTFPVAAETATDFWTPTFGGTFR